MSARDHLNWDEFGGLARPIPPRVEDAKNAPRALYTAAVSDLSSGSYPQGVPEGDEGSEGWDVSRLAEDMQYQGQIQSLDIDPVTMTVTDGEHRLEAARRLGWSRVLVEPLDERDIERA